ncbi:hypothetical protein Nocox_09620 [Nonomuraea coxensis DSM 45129]|uniref:Uncharacterized protein n=1 Tax=Nonomuraea coxensis DSM 45129 TaxID=1122611 RepID=A0ABX8TW20_9ACTN|nr:hypothetical protein [Nonomuraea coxensis]QYC39544.1 hypothetical protein Nocox_09620 [Nonomuraea coxensis DSM 45129]
MTDPALRRTPLTPDERVRAEAGFVPLVTEHLRASGRFRITADSPEMADLWQSVARQAGEVLRRPVVSYANGRDIVIMFGGEPSNMPVSVTAQNEP